MNPAPRGRPVRVITRTMSDGFVAFNQAVMEQQSAPNGILFVAIDPGTGLHLWLRPFGVVDSEATVNQAPGYSRTLAKFNPLVPPAFMGEAVFIPVAAIEHDDPTLWNQILASNTNAKNRLIRELFGF